MATKLLFQVLRDWVGGVNRDGDLNAIKGHVKQLLRAYDADGITGAMSAHFQPLRDWVEGVRAVVGERDAVDMKVCVTQLLRAYEDLERLYGRADFERTNLKAVVIALERRLERSFSTDIEKLKQDCIDEGFKSAKEWMDQAQRFERGVIETAKERDELAELLRAEQQARLKDCEDRDRRITEMSNKFLSRLAGADRQIFLMTYQKRNSTIPDGCNPYVEVELRGVQLEAHNPPYRLCLNAQLTLCGDHKNLPESMFVDPPLEPTEEIPFPAWRKKTFRVTFELHKETKS